MKKYGQLGRIHTVPLEAVPAAVGSLLAVQGDYYAAVGWFIWGALYHFVGYGMNSYTDWDKGYDKEDENKQHHPLQRGAIKKSQAKAIIFSSLVAYTMVTTAAVAYSGNLSALVLVFAQAVGGLFYNYFGKETPLKFISISISHSMAFAIPYVVMGGDVFTDYFVMAFIFMIIWIVYQIGVSGEIKDITQDEENFLKEMGTKVLKEHDGGGHKVVYGDMVSPWGAGLTTAKVIIAAVVFVSTAEFGPGVAVDTAISGVVIVLCCVAMMNMDSKMLSGGRFDRGKMIQTMSSLELVTLTTFSVMLGPIIGYMPSVVIPAISFIWVVVFNKALWGTTISPEV